MEISRNWRLQKQRYGLIGEVCDTCEHKIFPPRDICPHCAETAKQQYQFSGTGKVYSYTTVYDAPKGFEEFAPYTIAIVELAEGPRVTAQITDCDNGTLKIGQVVEMVTRILSKDGDRGPITYGYKFRPLLVNGE
jgi:uncharacterized OB-fold protein